MIKITREKEIITVVGIEDILQRASVIEYNDNMIEVPNVVMIKRKNSTSLLEKILNPGIEILDVEDEDFNKMIEMIISYQSNNDVVTFDEKTKPSKYVVLNLEKLKSEKIFTRITEDSIYMNNYVFTNNEFEFHGSGMFTSKRVLFLSFDDLHKVKEILS